VAPWAFPDLGDRRDPVATLRILYVTHYALPHIGGVEAVVDRMARELIRRGHEVEQIAAGLPGDPPAIQAPPGGPLVRRARAWNVIEERTGLPYPLYGPELVRLLRPRIAWADVVHAHGFLFLPSIISLSLAKSRARRFGGRPARVLTEHGARGAYESRALRAMESTAIHTVGVRTLRSAQTVVALNERIADFVHELAPQTQVIDIPNGVDTEAYRPPHPGERDAIRESFGWDERPRILFVGRLVPRKGAQLAADAARQLGDDVELVLAGPGRMQDAPSNVEPLGEIPPAKVAELYRAADCFLLPSIAEGFPATAQQALASGLPTILADDPVYGPYLDGAPNGVILVERDVTALVNSLRGIDYGRAIDPDQRSLLAAFAAERYSLERSVNRHEELYGGLVGREPESARAE
jgi:D-inositol-3-phosphate glycosyltransferase